MSERKIITNGSVGVKDSSGAYVIQNKDSSIQEPVEEKLNLGDISVDNLMRLGLESIYFSIKKIHADSRIPTRETIQNLKDLMSMLRDLKKDEKDILSQMSDEELEDYASIIQAKRP